MNTTMSVLHVEHDHAVLQRPNGTRVTLAVSPQSLAARHWPRGRPSSPQQVEMAIDSTENAIEQSGLRHTGRTLLGASPSLRESLPPDLRGPGVVTRDAVEAEFSRWVAEVEAGAVSATQGPQAAALLMLRELMHHLGFQAFSAEGAD